MIRDDAASYTLAARMLVSVSSVRSGQFNTFGHRPLYDLVEMM
jgi:hypothetical protein